MEVAEKVANEYSETVDAYNTVKAFVDTTHSDNVMLVSLLTDMESILPTGATVDKLTCADGVAEFTITTQGKEGVADAYVRIGELEYVDSIDFYLVDEKKIVDVDDDGHEIVNEEANALHESAPYNYSNVRDEYIVTVKLRDLNFTPGGEVESDVAPESDSEDAEGGNE